MFVTWFKNGLPSKTCMKSGNQIQIQHQELSFHGVIDLSELLGQRHAKKESLVLILFEKWWQTNFAPCVGRWWLLQNRCLEVHPCTGCVANSVSCPPASSQLQPQNSWWHRCLDEMQSYYDLKNKRNCQFTFQLRNHIEIVFSMRSPSHSWKVVDSCAKAQNWRSWQSPTFRAPHRRRHWNNDNNKRWGSNENAIDRNDDEWTYQYVLFLSPPFLGNGMHKPFLQNKNPITHKSTRLAKVNKSQLQPSFGQIRKH